MDSFGNAILTSGAGQSSSGKRAASSAFGEDGVFKRLRVGEPAYNLPDADGALDEVLRTDGNGTVAWVPAAAPDPVLINHNEIQNVGLNTHDQLDNHVVDTVKHWDGLSKTMASGQGLVFGLNNAIVGVGNGSLQIQAPTKTTLLSSELLVQSEFSFGGLPLTLRLDNSDFTGDVDIEEEHQLGRWTTRNTGNWRQESWTPAGQASVEVSRADYDTQVVKHEWRQDFRKGASFNEGLNTLSLPATRGGLDQVLVSNGDGSTTWAQPSIGFVPQHACYKLLPEPSEAAFYNNEPSEPPGTWQSLVSKAAPFDLDWLLVDETPGLIAISTNWPILGLHNVSGRTIKLEVNASVTVNLPDEGKAVVDRMETQIGVNVGGINPTNWTCIYTSNVEAPVTASHITVVSVPDQAEIVLQARNPNLELFVVEVKCVNLMLRSLD